ncbi:hypothetical protein [Dyadobacter sandarakinus]|uniref:DUF4148 domain-containing protein n=1 Tax=Dyadobacter sandarakinus TaxID=2747268 RepID=A0ABX7I6U9_9BACT|nr:hypothetical protein [Dyadobacter sandarakinus]QRR00696.1 hypothetical protein HWI92_07145 [Dyadobacter sandarakinus]
MKKSIIFAVAAMLSAATVSYAQSSASNATGQSNTDSRKETPGATKPGGGSATKTNGDKGGGQPLQQAQKTTAGDGATRPGGESHKNANDVGRYSENEDSKSMTHSREAIEIRRKNMTEPDVTVKEGSGSSERNTKNHTGFTGNYQNNDSKQSLKSKSDE